MEIKELKISEIETNKGQLKGLPKNPRLIKNDRFKKLVDSLRESKDFLKIREIVVFPLSENKYITIAGNQRLSALKELGEKTVLCKILPSNTTIEKLKEFTIKDNVSYGEMDWEVVNTEWDITEVESWGEEQNEVREKKNERDKKESELSIRLNETISDIKDGDLFELNNHILLCGDSTNPDNIKKVTGGNKIELVLTDPPYEIDFDYESLRTIDNAHIFIFNNDRAIVNQLKGSTLNFKKFFVFYHPSCAIPQEGGNEVFLDHVLISHEVKGKPKVRYNKGNGTRSVIKAEYRKSKNHKHEKHFDVLSPIIEGYSDKGDYVIDFFAGSGSTLRACETLGRKCVTIELDSVFCKIIIEEFLKENPLCVIKRNGIDETDLWIKELDKNGSKD